MTLLAPVAVRSVERLSASFVRIDLTGPRLADFGVDGPTYDIRIKLLFPQAGRALPTLADDTWWSDLQALPDAERGHLRTYTIREVRGTGTTTGIVVDFVLHPDAHGPGSSWAAAAQVGDEILAVVPRRGVEWGGIEWCPGRADRVLLVGDETAVPAICSILASLPAGARGSAVLEVPDGSDVQRVEVPVGVDVQWLPRNGAPLGSLAIAAVTGTRAGALPGPASGGDAQDELLWETPTYSASGETVEQIFADGPAGGPSAPPSVYAWVAGESTMVRALRRHLVTDRGMHRDQVSFMGYWRRGVAMRG